MPTNAQALLLVLLFIVPGFVLVEVDSRLRPSQKLAAFDKTVLSVLFSAILHAFLLWLILLGLWGFGVDLSGLLDADWAVDWLSKHVLLIYTWILIYFALSVAIAVRLGFKVSAVTGKWVPVLSRIVRSDKPNPVLVQMKNGDFYTGILGVIPADYDVLQSSAKDFTIRPPGRYKPKGKRWQKLQDGETVLLNTTNIDAIRIMYDT